MESLFEELCSSWTTSLSNEEIKGVIDIEWTRISFLNESYDRSLFSMLWRAIGRDRMENLLLNLSSDQKRILITDNIVEIIYAREGLQYLFSFIDTHLQRRYSLLYTVETYGDISCILDHICSSDNVDELMIHLDKFHVSSSEFNRKIIDQYQ